MGEVCKTCRSTLARILRSQLLLRLTFLLTLCTSVHLFAMWERLAEMETHAQT
jgi:hypothetical protein